MQSNKTNTQAVNSIQVAQKNKHDGRGIFVCVDFDHEQDAKDANEVAHEVATALLYEENASKAAAIADRLDDDRLHPFVKSLCSACTKNIKEIEDAELYGPTMAVTAAVIIADYQDKLDAAQQRNETLQMMLNYDKKEET